MVDQSKYMDKIVYIAQILDYCKSVFCVPGSEPRPGQQAQIKPVDYLLQRPDGQTEKYLAVFTLPDKAKAVFCGNMPAHWVCSQGVFEAMCEVVLRIINMPVLRLILPRNRRREGNLWQLRIFVHGGHFSWICFGINWHSLQENSDSPG